MTPASISYVTDISFFSGSQPAGPSLASALNLTTRETAPLLPTLGTWFLWQDNATQARYRGRVVFAGAFEFVVSGDHLVIKVQINLVDSVEVTLVPKTAHAVRQIDAALVGLWDAGGAQPLEIHADGAVFSLAAPMPYQITGNGMILQHLAGSPPLEFDRISAAGSGLIGLWSREQVDGGAVWREDVQYRADGSFTWHTSRDGVFDSEIPGLYSDTGTEFTAAERRASLTTGPGDFLAWAQAYGPLETGSYSVAPDGESWTYHKAAGDLRFVRVT